MRPRHLAIAAAVVAAAVFFFGYTDRSVRVAPAHLPLNQAAENPAVDVVPTTGPSPASSIRPPARARADTIMQAQVPGRSFERFEAISALGEANDAMNEVALIDLLYDPEPAIRELAVESLAVIGTPGAIQGLGFALTDADPLVRQTAIEYLAEIGTPEALGTLVVALNDPDPGLRLAAVHELGDQDSPVANSLLQQFLSDTDQSVRMAAEELLR